MAQKEDWMKTVTIEITGVTPLLMHADNIDWADKMEAWKNDPKNRKLSKAGDDRTPPWRWIGCLYCDDVKAGTVTIPSENIMKSIMEGAAQVPTGKGQKTFKSQSQSGLLCSDFQWPLLVDGKQVKMSDINELLELETFKEHVEATEMLGFSLFVKRARIGNAKHIRVRPRFDKWSVKGSIMITDSQITVDTMRSILEIAGMTKGLADWRPSSKTPGSWGMFKAKVS